MATKLGNQSSPTFGNNVSSQYNQVCPDSGHITTPAQKIIVTKLWAYFGGDSGSIAGCKLCIWKTDGTLLYSMPGQTFTVPQGRAWRGVDLTVKPLIAASTQLYVGWWSPTGHTMTWGVRNSGNWQGKQNQSSVSSMSGSSDPGSPFLQGEPGGYLEYVPAGFLFGDDSGDLLTNATVYIGDDDGSVVTADHIYIGDDDGSVIQIK